jgi:DNA repair protein RecN (Recombination protein N)
MLDELHIENLGVIAELDVVLGPGLTVLTGETGAGKTMIVEAISLLVGQRADPDMIRPGADELRVEGRLVGADGEEHVVARVVPRDGRSRAYIDGRLATVGQLADIAAGVIDLHGQHAHQGLLGVAAQREALDAFADIDVTELRAARAELADIEARLGSLGGDEASRARELDLVRFQVAELDAARLDDPDEDVRLDADIDLLQDAEGSRAALAAAIGALVDDDGAIDRLAASVAALGRRDALGRHVEALRAAQQAVRDAADDMRATAESTDGDPATLATLVERRAMIFDLRRKYGGSIAEMKTKLVALRERVAELESFDERAAELDARRTAARRRVATAAAAVGAARRAAAPSLAKAVQKVLRTLAMPHAEIKVDVAAESQDPAGDAVTFLLRANPGGEHLPLAKVASGGELARTMLATRLVVGDAPATMIFDEVDAGIGGEAAVAVADALAKLGDGHQVLVVTHLAQVAARARTHLHVAKSVRSGETFAVATTLTDDDRVTEIARMLSGDATAQAAVAHARDLLGRPARRTRR